MGPSSFHLRALRALAALALAVLAACAKPPSAAGCSTDVDCPSGSTCQRGVCQEGMALDFVAPAAARTYAAGGVPVAAAVAGSTPVTVAVLVDDLRVATLAPPFVGTLDTSALSEESHALVLVAELAGRTYRSPRRTIDVDRTAPAAPAIAGGATRAADPVTITGTWTVDAGTPVTLTLFEGEAVKAAGIAPSGGAWAASVPLAEGTHVFTAVAVDAAGNASPPSASTTLVVDRTAPVAPAIAAAVTGAPDPVTVTGTLPADAGTPVTVTVYEGADVKAAGVQPVAGAWSASFPLAEGRHGLTARSVDAAGNVSAPSEVATVLIDRTSPAPPAVLPVSTATDPVVVAGTWTSDSGAPVTIALSEGGTVLDRGIVPSGGTWSTSLTLAEGSHTVRAVATDAAGNASAPSAPATVWVDRTSPPTPAVTAAITGSQDPVAVKGTVPPDAGSPLSITVYEGATAKASGIAPSGGAWSAPVALTEGSHVLTAVAIDAARNASSASAGATIVVDRTPPPVPTVSSRTTNQANPVSVSGTLAADSGTAVTITVYEGSAVKMSGIVPGGGTWTAPLTLADGTHTLTAEAVDAAGNVSGSSSPAAVVVDRTRPAPPTVTASISPASSTLVSGTCAVDGGTPVTISVYEGETRLGSGITPTGGSWSAAFTLGEGTHALTAVAIDAAGNASDPSAAADVVVDLTDPWIVASTPGPGATNVWTRDPITVTFSEPMARGSVGAGTVLLARSGGAAVTNTPSLSGDGLTLTVRPTTLPAVPDTFTLTLNGLTDRAGRALRSVSWSWTAPEWQELGMAISANPRSSLCQPAIAVGSDELPVVAASWLGTGTSFGLRRWTGTASSWAALPSPTVPGVVTFSALAAASAQDVTAAFVTNSSDVWAGRFTGADWSGGAVLDSAQASAAGKPAMALGTGGVPYVAWIEAAGGIDRIFARRWSGSSWELLGGGALSSATIAAASPTVTAGVTQVAWTETGGSGSTAQTSAWSGSAWSAALGGAFGTGPSGVVIPFANGAGTLHALALTAAGKVQVWTWVPGGSIYSAPSHWQQLGGDLNIGTGAASDPIMAFDPSGYPVVAWYEVAGATTGIWAKRWDTVTAGWVSLTATPLTGGPFSGLRAPITVSPAGVVVLGRFIGSGLSTGVQVARYNR